MFIKDMGAPPWVTCKRCGKSFRMGKSCGCGAVRTRENRDGSFEIVEHDENVAVIDTE